MSKDIAEIEILGPNSKAMLGAIEQYTLKKAALKDAKGGTKNFSEKAAGHIKKMKTLYNIHHNNKNQKLQQNQLSPVLGFLPRILLFYESFLTSMR